MPDSELVEALTLTQSKAGMATHLEQPDFTATDFISSLYVTWRMEKTLSSITSRVLWRGCEWEQFFSPCKGGFPVARIAPQCISSSQSLPESPGRPDSMELDKPLQLSKSFYSQYHFTEGYGCCESKFQYFQEAEGSCFRRLVQRSVQGSSCLTCQSMKWKKSSFCQRRYLSIT